MKTYGLIGYPLSHSFSQKYFTQKFADEKADARYLLFSIPSIEDFDDLLRHHPYIAGLNVTIPYKEKIIPFLHELDSSAADVGAVNVIKVTWNGSTPHLKGYNSDTYGFMQSLMPLLQPSHQRGLILGTGGASKAVAYVLNKLNIPCTFVSRQPHRLNDIHYSEVDKQVIQSHTIIVNTSPVGMYPYPDNCPDIPYEFITPEHIVYDLIYNPELTLFLSNAEKRGAVVKNGIEMLFLQARRAWEIWNEQD
jgi:shikimate dehydrogenase